MATIKNHDFGEVTTMLDKAFDIEDHLIRLKFDLNLGNNFSYDHFVAAVFKNMGYESIEDHFIEFTNSLNLSDTLIIISKNNKELKTCTSDFADHTRSPWIDHCSRTYH